MLDERKLDVLRAIVTDYVSTQEPVGSKALVERHHLDVSPATIRNDMAALEDEGLLTQPHTSAGRIPTDKGYRLFVDRLATVKPLSGAERRAIATFMQGAVDVDDIVARTVRLLAQITRHVAIMQYPQATSTTVRHIELVDLTADRILVIVIRSTGRVDQRVVEMPGVDLDTLSTLSHWSNAMARDCQVGAAAQKLAHGLTSLAPDLQRAASALVATLVELLTADRSTQVAVGGVPNLARFGDQYDTMVRPVLEALEEQVVLLQLLGEAVHDASSGDVAVRIGHENPYVPLRSTSVVASSYTAGDDAWATLGVVGPTRMDYPSTMAAVRAVAQYVGRFLMEG
ncbi:MAG: heat-inducible transcriptional repressor HrcA [Propionibacteriaceae bacterium]|nr:heat-inducible transcriptional repressor HrcA [Propionibacteriaceae bacterium]